MFIKYANNLSFTILSRSLFPEATLDTKYCIGQSFNKEIKAKRRTEKVDNGAWGWGTGRVDETEHLTMNNYQNLRLLLAFISRTLLCEIVFIISKS